MTGAAFLTAAAINLVPLAIVIAPRRELQPTTEGPEGPFRGTTGDAPDSSALDVARIEEAA